MIRLTFVKAYVLDVNAILTKADKKKEINIFFIFIIFSIIEIGKIKKNIYDSNFFSSGFFNRFFQNLVALVYSFDKGIH